MNLDDSFGIFLDALLPRYFKFLSLCYHYDRFKQKRPQNYSLFFNRCSFLFDFFLRASLLPRNAPRCASKIFRKLLTNSVLFCIFAL